MRTADDGAEILQFWVADEVMVQGYVDQDPAVYTSARGYSRKVVMARLETLGDEQLRELLVESWMARATATMRRRYAEGLETGRG